jgi:hypothetical protein
LITSQKLEVVGVVGSWPGRDQGKRNPFGLRKRRLELILSGMKSVKCSPALFRCELSQASRLRVD